MSLKQWHLRQFTTKNWFLKIVSKIESEIVRRFVCYISEDVLSKALTHDPHKKKRKMKNDEMCIKEHTEHLEYTKLQLLLSS